MRIAIAQIDPVVGAFEANLKKVKEAYQRAVSKKARVLVTPELSLFGYPPHDLIERPEIFERNEKTIDELLALTRGKSTALVVGHVAATPSEFGRAAQNVITVLEEGKRVFRQAKTLLPTYDVFDEARYFEPASDIQLWNCDGQKIALAICEDLWANDPSLDRPIYGKNPTDCYREQEAEMIISLSASPYEWGKRARREELHQDTAHALGIPLIYVNQVGATDEILFDGGSFAVHSDGKFAGRLPLFKNSFGILEIQSGKVHWESPLEEGREDQAPSEIEVLHRALVCGIRDYFDRTGFRKAIIGLSGGIDSAVVACLAVEALGAAQVLGLAMPSQYSSGHSLADAELLAKNLGVKLEVKPIKFLFSQAIRELSEGRGTLASLAQENLQSRLRGMMLMTLSNHDNSLVLTTGNKSEIATGYCTLYGDMVGAIAPIGDVYKTRVYELAGYINQKTGGVIPVNSISKAPSAELKPNQKDQDTLPPYDSLDALLEDYIEHRMALEELEAKYGKMLDIRAILRRVELNEYKRRQSAVVFKTTRKAFGIGRRIPLARSWEL